jgi:hypothetical protein
VVGVVNLLLLAGSVYVRIKAPSPPIGEGDADREVPAGVH